MLVSSEQTQSQTSVEEDWRKAVLFCTARNIMYYFENKQDISMSSFFAVVVDEWFGMFLETI